MALIQCPECKKEVSDRAEKCPNCACPLTGSSTGAQAINTQTIELTSKSLKKQMIFAVLLLLGAFVLTIIGAVNEVMALGTVGIIGAVAAIIWMIVIKIRKWWHHD